MKQSPSALWDEFEIVEIEEAVGGGELEADFEDGFGSEFFFVQVAFFLELDFEILGNR